MFFLQLQIKKYLYFETMRPARTYAQQVEHRNEYLEQLKLREELNKLNYEAVDNYRQTGQIPPISQVRDPRTVADILADSEKLKVDMIQTISQYLGSKQLGLQIVYGIIRHPRNVDNKLFIFAAQRMESIMEQVARNHRYGFVDSGETAQMVIEFIVSLYDGVRNVAESTMNFAQRYSKPGSNDIEGLKIQLGTISTTFELIKRNVDSVAHSIMFDLQTSEKLLDLSHTMDMLFDLTRNMFLFFKKFPIEEIQRLEEEITQDKTNIDARGVDETVLLDIFQLLKNLPSPSYVQGLIADFLNKYKDFREILKVLSEIYGQPRTPQRDVLIETQLKNLRVCTENLKTIAMGLISILNPNDIEWKKGLKTIIELENEYNEKTNVDILTQDPKDLVSAAKTLYNNIHQHLPINSDESYRRIVAMLQRIKDIRMEFKARVVHYPQDARSQATINMLDSMVNQITPILRQYGGLDDGSSSLGGDDRSSGGDDSGGSSSSGGDDGGSSLGGDDSGGSSSSGGDNGIGMIGDIDIDDIEKKANAIKREIEHLEGELVKAKSKKYKNMIGRDINILIKQLNELVDGVGQPNNVVGEEPIQEPIQEPKIPEKTEQKLPPRPEPKLPERPTIDIGAPSEIQDFLNEAMRIRREVKTKAPYMSKDQIERNLKIADDYDAQALQLQMDRRNQIRGNKEEHESDEITNEIKRIIKNIRIEKNKISVLEEQMKNTTNENEIQRLKDSIDKSKLNLEELNKRYTHVSNFGLDDEPNIETKEGSGIVKKRKPRVRGCGISREIAEGVKPQPRYANFGKYQINTKALGEGIFSIRYARGTKIPEHPNLRISKNFQNVLNKIIGGSVPTYDDYNSLGENERAYLYKVSQRADIGGKLSVPAPKKDAIEKEIHQFEVERGEILSGNNNKQLIASFKARLLKLEKAGALPRAEVNDVLRELFVLN